MFGIKLKTLKMDFPGYLDSVLDLTKRASFNEKTNTYDFVDFNEPMIGTVEDLRELKKEISAKQKDNLQNGRRNL